MEEKQELDNLAQALVKQGLAASYADGLEKAKQIMGIKEVIEKKRRDFLGENKEEVDKAVEKMTTPQKEESREEMVEHIKEEVVEVKDVIKKAEEKPEPEKVALIKEKVDNIRDEVKVVEKEIEKEKSEDGKKDSKEKGDKFKEEKKIDISEVFDYNKR
ncbi:hypothetical protein KY361_07815 [Candidatus Woesearchaeota archaeon]|nr:hypothetical protein [Candidatus Woesearchaeota archaeon]